MVSANTQLLLERKSEWAEEMQIRDTLEQVVLKMLVGAGRSFPAHPFFDSWIRPWPYIWALRCNELLHHDSWLHMFFLIQFLISCTFFHDLFVF
jgi:hypothetical protein